MNVFQGIMRFLSAVISVYSLVIVLRILLTWFQGARTGRAMEILHKVTEPYLAWFRRFGFLHIGSMDFSPIMALIVLSVAGSVAARLGAALTVTFGLVLAIFIAQIAQSAGFFVGLFLVLALIRAVGSMSRIDTSGQFWTVLDQLLEPVVIGSVNYFARGKFVSYRNSLLFFAGGMAAVLILGRYVIALLVSLVLRLPF